jgi:hypothetical protein
MFWRRLLLYLFFASRTMVLPAQQTDSSKNVFNLSGAASVTNNGISLIPNFSLNKPAAVFNVSAGKNRFSFDPELAFSLEGKPWYFLFWLRYKVANAGRFKFTAGTHLGLNFKKAFMPAGNDSAEVRVVDRYLVAELAPNYSIANNISVGLYYLYSRGLDPGANKQTHFVTINANFSHIPLSKSWFIRFTPQFYYLDLDQGDGFYFSAMTTLARKNFPVTISSVINKAIRTDIAGKNLVWNLSLAYSFSKKHILHRGINQ